VGFDLLLAQNKLSHFSAAQVARFALSARACGREAELSGV
jgi:hypothetical protein